MGAVKAYFLDANGNLPYDPEFEKWLDENHKKESEQSEELVNLSGLISKPDINKVSNG